jgi:hypothetical protein
MLGIEEKMGGAFAIGGLADIAAEICPEHTGCANDASFNKDCTCLCSGLWSGASCDECNIECGEHGRKDEETCTCQCYVGYFGPDCENKFLGYWKDESTLQFELTLPEESWKGLGYISWFYDAEYTSEVEPEYNEQLTVHEREGVVDYPLSKAQIDEATVAVVGGKYEFYFGLKEQLRLLYARLRMLLVGMLLLQPSPNNAACA